LVAKADSLHITRKEDVAKALARIDIANGLKAPATALTVPPTIDSVPARTLDEPTARRVTVAPVEAPKKRFGVKS
jgi:hypothetical protein